LGGGAGVGLGEAQGAAAQAQHGGLKGEPGPGGGLEEEGGQLLVGAGVLIFGGVGDDVLCGGDQLIDLLHREVGDVNEISGHGRLLSKGGWEGQPPAAFGFAGSGTSEVYSMGPPPKPSDCIAVGSLLPYGYGVPLAGKRVRWGKEK